MPYCITRQGCKCVMLPALGTGVYGFAHGAVAPWVRETLKQYVKERDVRLRLLVMEEQIAALYR